MEKNKATRGQNDSPRSRRRSGWIVVRRIMLLFIYILLSTGAILILHPFSEGQRMEPLILVTSWALFLCGLLGSTFSNGSITYVVLLGSYLLYLIGLIILNSSLSRRIRTRLPIVPIIVHYSGVAYSFFKIGTFDAAYRPAAFERAGYVLIVLMSIIYFSLDWRCAGDPRPRNEDLCGRPHSRTIEHQGPD
jgi:hypothetical protein